MQFLTDFRFSDGESHDGHDHEPAIYADKTLAMLIDPVLQNDDKNNDGMIDWKEFVLAQLKSQVGDRPVVEVSV